FYGGLPAGVYSVAVEMDGKLVEQARDVTLSPRQTMVLDFDISEDQAKSQRAKAIEDASLAEDRARVRAACAAIYDITENKKVGDLTVKEDQQVRACQASDLYPPR